MNILDQMRVEFRLLGAEAYSERYLRKNMALFAMRGKYSGINRHRGLATYIIRGKEVNPTITFNFRIDTGGIAPLIPLYMVPTLEARGYEAIRLTNPPNLSGIYDIETGNIK